MSSTTGGHEKREFQAETRQLLDLMIHSIYSNPDTFLREVISNGSDALDKLRLAAVTEDYPGVDTSDLHLELIPDAGEAGSPRRLTITDNGIGMSREEVIDLIGTLAKSGTAAMRETLAAARSAAADGELSEQATADLIGQFGIGFYSTFMVADTVTLVTRKAGEDEVTLWRSSGEDTYDIATVPVADAATLDFDGAVPTQGTSIALDLKPAGGDTELPDYADANTLRRVVRTYSDFIAWPIRMEVPAPADAAGADDADTEDDASAEEKSSTMVETLNSQKALWTRPQSEVTDEEYTEFYRHVSHAWDEPAETMTIRAEGSFEYQALLFIPSQPPFDLFSPDHRRGVQLYVRRVFIMDDAEALIPQYLRFVKGVVDAADLSLNVSREILQQDRQIGAIRKRIVRKTLQTVNAMRENEAEKFAEFWQHFGSVVKEGLISDTGNREQILAFAEFESTRAGEAADTEEKAEASEGPARTTLTEYLGRMVEGQTEVYYITGASRAAVENSPHLEAFRARGVEVLLLTDPVDEVWVDAVGDVEGKPLRSIAKGDVDLEKVGTAPEGESAEEEKKEDADFAPLLAWLGEALDDRVKEVRLSHRLVDSPACMVGDTFDLSPQLERMYRANGMDVPASKRILELNPKHAAVEKLRAEFAATSDEDTAARAELADTAEVLAGIAVLAEGGELADPAAFAKLLAGRL